MELSCFFFLGVKLGLTFEKKYIDLGQGAEESACTCRFHKGTSYSGIKVFNSLPRSITSLKNEKTQFRIALKKFLYSHSFVDEFFAYTDDIYC
jgi:hypothetical protein